MTSIGHTHGYARKAGRWLCVADYQYWPSLGCGEEAKTLSHHQQDSRTGQGVSIDTPLSVPFEPGSRTGHEQDTEQDTFEHEMPANRTRTGHRTGHFGPLRLKREQDTEQDSRAAWRPTSEAKGPATTSSVTTSRAK